MKYGILHYVFGLVLLGVLFGVLLRMKKSPNEPYTSPNPSAGASMRGSSMKAPTKGPSMRGSSMKAPTKGPSLGVKGPSLPAKKAEKQTVPKGASYTKNKDIKKGGSGPKTVTSAGASGTKKKAGASLSSGVKGTSMGMSTSPLKGVSLKGGPASGASLTQLFGPSYASVAGSSMISLEKENKNFINYSIATDDMNACVVKYEWGSDGDKYCIYMKLNLVFQGVTDRRETIPLTHESMDKSKQKITLYLVSAEKYWPSDMGGSDMAYPDEPTLLKGDAVILELDDDAIVWGNSTKDGKSVATASVEVEMPVILLKNEGEFSTTSNLRMETILFDDSNPTTFQSQTIEERGSYDADWNPFIFNCAEHTKKLSSLIPKSAADYVLRIVSYIPADPEDYISRLFTSGMAGPRV